MNALQTHLRDDDPVAHEPPPSTAEVQRMRRAVLAAAEAPQPKLAVEWRRAWAVAGAFTVLAAAVGANLWPRSASTGLSPSSDGHVESPSRQLQFATPGGTRVIWVFNPDFQP